MRPNGRFGWLGSTALRDGADQHCWKIPGFTLSCGYFFRVQLGAVRLTRRMQCSRKEWPMYTLSLREGICQVGTCPLGSDIRSALEGVY